MGKGSHPTRTKAKEGKAPAGPPLPAAAPPKAASPEAVARLCEAASSSVVQLPPAGSVTEEFLMDSAAQLVGQGVQVTVAVQVATAAASIHKELHSAADSVDVAVKGLEQSTSARAHTAPALKNKLCFPASWVNTSSLCFPAAATTVSASLSTGGSAAARLVPG